MDFVVLQRLRDEDLSNNNVNIFRGNENLFPYLNMFSFCPCDLLVPMSLKLDIGPDDARNKLEELRLYELLY